MATFYIQEPDGSLSQVSHNEFYEALNGGDDYLCYEQGGSHIAMLPTETNAEAIRVCNKSDDDEKGARFTEIRCQNEKGQLCRFRHDENGRVIRNGKGYAVRAKCGECPRDGWIAGKRENCCIRNYCKAEDCARCPHLRESHRPLSLDQLTESKYDDDTDGVGLFIIDPDADIQAAFENKELKTALLAALGELAPKARAVLKAVYWGEMSQRAHSCKTGIPAATVNRLHNRAAAALKEILKDFR